MKDPEIAELYGLIRGLTNEVGKLSVAVARIEERMETAKNLEPRVTALELTRAQMQGVGMAGRALWAFIGAGGVGVVVGVIQLLTTHAK